MRGQSAWTARSPRPPAWRLEWGQGDDVLDVLEDESVGGGVVGGEAGAVVVEVRDQVLAKDGHADCC